MPIRNRASTYKELTPPRTLLGMPFESMLCLTRNGLRNVQKYGKADEIFLNPTQKGLVINKYGSAYTEFFLVFQSWFNLSDSRRLQLSTKTNAFFDKMDEDQYLYNEHIAAYLDARKMTANSSNDKKGTLKYEFARNFGMLVLTLVDSDCVSILPSTRLFYHVLLNMMSHRFRNLSRHPLPLPVQHEQIVSCRNEKLQNIFNAMFSDMESRDNLHLFHVFAVLLAPGAPALEHANRFFLNCTSITEPKCHCAILVISSTVVNSMKWSGADMTNMAFRSLICSVMQSPLYNRTHAHFCANCGLFESKNRRMKVCKACKNENVSTRFMFCSMKCQIGGWVHHKYLHRANKALSMS